MSGVLGIRDLGLQPYEPVLEAMRRFTEQRGPDSQDEVWLVEHPPVFTQGQAGKAEHLLIPGEIPVVQTVETVPIQPPVEYADPEPPPKTWIQRLKEFFSQ